MHKNVVTLINKAITQTLINKPKFTYEHMYLYAQKCVNTYK